MQTSYWMNNANFGVPLPIAVVRYFEREAHLNLQRPQTQRMPDRLLVLLDNGALAFMSYTDAVARNLRVLQHPLNYNHLFPESQLVNIDMTLPPWDLSLNESFYNDIPFSYSIQEPDTTDAV